MHRASLLGIVLIVCSICATSILGFVRVPEDAQTAAKLGSQYCTLPYAPNVEWSAKRAPTDDWWAWPGDANGPYCGKTLAIIRARDGQMFCELAKCASNPPAGTVSTLLKAEVDRSVDCTTSYYPPAAVRANEQGTATVRAHIGADGSVTAVDLVQSTGYADLDDGAVQCLKIGWHFRPAMQDGKPVPSTKTYAIKFALQ